MLFSEFDFDLPQDRIAQRPVEPRHAARLLRVTGAGLEDRIVRDLPALLLPGDLLVFNDTRVIPARLTGLRGAAKISVTLHQAVGTDVWRVFAKPAKRLHPGDRIVFGNPEAPSPSSPHLLRGSTLGFPSSSRVDARNTYGHDEEKKSSDTFSASVIERRPEGDVVLRFDRGGVDLMRALETYGQMPLPPYIRGGVADARDRADYQTVFAAHEGAVAAPTAALHFTPALMAALAERGVKTAMLTLHVGAGTFLPVKVEDTNDHVMHAEIGVLNQATADAVNETHRAGHRVIAVGTTSLRLLESAATDDGAVHPFAQPTSIFITPGYRFRAVDLLLTNFHLPRSTLMMLVAAFAGLDRIRTAYAHAIASGYRFYSYGDCCLLDPAEAA